MQRRKIFLFIILFICFLGLLFKREVYRAMDAGLQILKGRKTVGQRVEEYGASVRQRLSGDFEKKGISFPPASMVLIGLKKERLLEVWISGDHNTYQLLKTYPIFGTSGKLGPKLQEGDRQVPEGIYGIESLNPNSRFHLALRIDYPNEFDRRMAKQDGRTGLGGDIMIHGSYVSIGCLAIGDEAAEDLFVLAALAKPENIQVILSPADFRLHDMNEYTAGMPDWVPSLYQQIKTKLQKFIINTQ